MIAVLEYGTGNVGSVCNMLRRIGAPAAATHDSAEIEAADKIVLPGVGAFDCAVRQLGALDLIPVLRRRVLEQRVPLLGICLGMQLLGESSAEGHLPGLGWLRARTERLRADGVSPPPRLPHMQWSTLRTRRADPLLAGLTPEWRFYFVHSYHLVCGDPEDLVATAEYGCEFAAVVRRGNILGVQFHPEKSHRFGMALLSNFVRET